MAPKQAKRAATSRKPPVRRMTRENRVAAMLDGAAPILAERGLATSTRQIAAELGVTQALIYKHFSSKEAFIASVLSRSSGGRSRDAAALLADTSRPLVDRLTALYSGTSGGGGDGTRIRLFVRAALEGWPLPARRGAALTREVFEPVVRALREDAGLPSPEAMPMMRGERELAMMLHASIVFLGIRRHVYRMPMADDHAGIVRLHVETFLAGALTTLRRIHAGETGDAMTVELLTPAKPAGRREGR